MNISKETLRHIMYYEYKLAHPASDAYRNICQAFGEGFVSRRTVSSWYKRFDNGDFSIEDTPRSGRPTEIDLELLKELVECEPSSSTRSLASQLGCSHSTVEYHLGQLGFHSIKGVWEQRD